MNVLVQEAIKRIYLDQDYDFYTAQCTKELVLPQGIAELLNNSKLNVVEFCPSKKCCPSKKWSIHFDQVAQGAFEAKFKSILMLSKIIPIFYLQHDFSVKNPIEERMTSFLDGFSGQAYTRTQFEIDEQISQILTQFGYLKLDFREINEVIFDLTFPTGVTIFGSQVTVEYALFHDLLELCSENS